MSDDIKILIADIVKSKSYDVFKYWQGEKVGKSKGVSHYVDSLNKKLKSDIKKEVFNINKTVDSDFKQLEFKF